jgi:enoyl-CoA hydratase/carnithine racemase
VPHEVVYEIVGTTALVTVNRPEVRNALDQAALDGLRDAFTAAASDDEVRVVVVTGAGTEAFSAGADLKAIAAGWRPDLSQWPVLGRNVHLDKPVIAAVDGIAYGGGFNLAMSCDLCVASTTARFGVTEARWGRGFDWAALLPRLIPARVAMEMFVTAVPIDATRAHQVGLVNRVVAPGDVREAALDMAAVIGANAPLSVRAGKALVHRALADDIDGLVADATELFAPVYASADAAEGARAFSESRAPQWSGVSGSRDQREATR